MLDAYCKMFELDWRGEKQAILNKEFLSSSPINIEGTNLKDYGELTNEKLRHMLKKACSPYVPQVVS